MLYECVLRIFIYILFIKQLTIYNKISKKMYNDFCTYLYNMKKAFQIFIYFLIICKLCVCVCV